MNQVNWWQYKVISKNWFTGVGLFFFTLFIYLSPLVNLVGHVGKSIPILFYPFLVIFGIIALFPINKNYLPTVVVAGIIIVASFSFFGYIVKGIAASLVFCVAYRGVRQSKLIMLNVLLTLLIINYWIVLLQLSGIFEIVYSFVDFANDATPISFLDVDLISADYLPQIRPSGIFPTPTYISFFSIILYSIAAYFHIRISRWFMVMIGSFFILTGSTLGLVLIVLLAMNVFRDKVIVWAILGYVVTLSLYFALVPEIAAYNFSVNDFSSSILDRNLSESILTTNPKLFVTLALFFGLAVFYFLARFSVSLFDFLPIIILIFLPILLHDASQSLLSFFNLGLAAGMFVDFVDRQNMKPRKSFNKIAIRNG